MGLTGLMLQTSEEFERLLAAARARYEAMSPAERERLHRVQRAGWVKAEMQWAEDFRNGLCERD